MVDDSRGRGILTETDREWLRNQTGGSTDSASHQVDSQRRKAITDRITNALQDFDLLVDELPDRMLRDVVTNFGSNPSLYEDLSPAVAFLYQVANEKEYLAEGLRLGVEPGVLHFRTFERALDEGINRKREDTDRFRSPSDDNESIIPKHSNLELYERPPYELISFEDIADRWREYGQWDDPTTGKKLYESKRYTPTEAAQIAFGNIMAGIEQAQQRNEQSRLQVPRSAEDLVADHGGDNDTIDGAENEAEDGS